MSSTKENRWPSYGLRIFLNTVSHPFEYAKVLMQIGYEPLPPYPSTTLFGRPAMKLPNVFQYVHHIYVIDGLAGCYRGLGPKLCGSLISAYVTQKTAEYLELERRLIDEDDDDEDETSDQESYEYRRRKFIKCLKGDIIIHSVAIIASNSFNVITVRMMSQFIGKETKYTGVFGSILAIYNENGVMGFFSGIVPRLLGDILGVLLASTLAYICNSYFIHDKELQKYGASAMSLLASSIMYPFQVVSNCMAVTDSGLTAGRPPQMPIYHNWFECWSDLSSREQLKRGSSLFVRYYTVPTTAKKVLEVGLNRNDRFPF